MISLTLNCGIKMYENHQHVQVCFVINFICIIILTYLIKKVMKSSLAHVFKL